MYYQMSCWKAKQCKAYYLAWEYWQVPLGEKNVPIQLQMSHVMSLGLKGTPESFQNLRIGIFFWRLWMINWSSVTPGRTRLGKYLLSSKEQLDSKAKKCQFGIQERVYSREWAHQTRPSERPVLTIKKQVWGIENYVQVAVLLTDLTVWCGLQHVKETLNPLCQCCSVTLTHTVNKLHPPHTCMV